MDVAEFVREIQRSLKEAKEHIDAVDKMSDGCWDRIRQVDGLFGLGDPRRSGFNEVVSDFHFVENAAQQTYWDIRSLAEQAAKELIFGAEADDLGGWAETVQGEVRPLKEARYRAKAALQLVELLADRVLSAAGKESKADSQLPLFF
jgi:hypothetical protein